MSQLDQLLKSPPMMLILTAKQVDELFIHIGQNLLLYQLGLVEPIANMTTYDDLEQYHLRLYDLIMQGLNEEDLRLLALNLMR